MSGAVLMPGERNTALSTPDGMDAAIRAAERRLAGSLAMARLAGPKQLLLVRLLQRLGPLSPLEAREHLVLDSHSQMASVFAGAAARGLIERTGEAFRWRVKVRS